MAEESNVVPIRIQESDWKKFMAYLRAAKPDEIIGLAHAEIKNGAVYVSNPMIFEQNVGPATCEITPEALAKFIGEYDHIEKVRCVWHSHVEMGAHFSSCDRDTSNTLAALGKMTAGENSWWVSIVINLRQEYEVAVDMYTPFNAKLKGAIQIIGDPVPAEVEEEVKALLKRRTYGSSTSGYYSGGGHWADRGVVTPCQEDKPGSTKVIVSGGKKREEPKSYTEDSVFGEFHLGGG